MRPTEKEGLGATCGQASCVSPLMLRFASDLGLDSRAVCEADDPMDTRRRYGENALQMVIRMERGWLRMLVRMEWGWQRARSWTQRSLLGYLRLWDVKPP